MYIFPAQIRTRLSHNLQASLTLPTLPTLLLINCPKAIQLPWPGSVPLPPTSSSGIVCVIKWSEMAGILVLIALLSKRVQAGTVRPRRFRSPNPVKVCMRTLLTSVNTNTSDRERRKFEDERKHLGMLHDLCYTSIPWKMEDAFETIIDRLEPLHIALNQQMCICLVQHAEGPSSTFPMVWSNKAGPQLAPMSSQGHGLQPLSKVISESCSPHARFSVAHCITNRDRFGRYVLVHKHWPKCAGATTSFHNQQMHVH